MPVGFGVSASGRKIVVYLGSAGDDLKRATVDYVLKSGLSVDEWLVETGGFRVFREMWSVIRRGGIAVVVIPSISVLPASTRLVLHFIHDCIVYNVELVSVGEAWLRDALLDDGTRRLIEALRGLERRVISEKTREGIARAKATGARVGRPLKLKPEQVLEAVRLYAEGASIASIARQLGVHKSTIYRYLKKYGFRR